MKKRDRLKRGAGILLPIFSLPSRYGIGTIGKEAFQFVDQLERAKQKYWQVLPIGPTGFGDSPYQAVSAFAGNPYLVDLESLVEEGLLSWQELDSVNWGSDASKVDYGAMWDNRFRVLYDAYARSNHYEDAEYKAFLKKQGDWVYDYALYMACKEHFGQASWLDWDEDIRKHKPAAVKKYKKELERIVNYHLFIQYKFFTQWEKLKAYANEHGVQIIGDMPLYMALDSSDVWANPQEFQLDADGYPTEVAGCPPDFGTPEGQKWGNPLYDWDKMEKEDFSWWRNRMKHATELFDVVRIDHFIGLVRYYSIPADKTGKDGKFKQGPAEKLTNVFDEVRGETKIIAENLGVALPEVDELLDTTGYPGMRMVIYGFDGTAASEHLPHRYPRNTVVYGGNQDSETLRGYFNAKDDWGCKYAIEYTGCRTRDMIVPCIVEMSYRSNADVAIFQIQDILGLDNSTRMNTPGTLGDNWKWRLLPGQFAEGTIQWLMSLCYIFGRTEYELHDE